MDDEAVNLKLLDRTLASAGYNRRILISEPETVVQQYLQHRPALILLDLNMPGMDGYEVMAALNKLEEPLLPPIVVLTAQSQQDYLMRALEAGARDFVSKPFDSRELLMRVHNFLDGHVAHKLVRHQKIILKFWLRSVRANYRRATWKSSAGSGTRLSIGMRKQGTTLSG